MLNDPGLLADARTRLDGFLSRSFYHDGFYRRGELQAHRKVLELLDGWVGILLASPPDARRSTAVNSSVRSLQTGQAAASPAGIPLISLARTASATLGPRPVDDAVERASWSGATLPSVKRRPILLGGAGLARLAVGRSANALALDVRGLDSYSGPHYQRLAVRLSLAGVPVLDDLDERATTATGWELATASHNTVVVNGLNQRETPLLAGKPAAGSGFRFFAADPDFQVVSGDDPRAYPQSASRYRHTLVVTASVWSCYAVSVFEVEGGYQHDQFFHAAPGRNEHWALSVPAVGRLQACSPRGSRSFPWARPDQGRWFVQSYGELRLDTQASLSGPGIAALQRERLLVEPATPPGSSWHHESDTLPSVRLHLLGDTPVTAFTAHSPDPTKDDKKHRLAGEEPWRASLVLRRQAAPGQSLDSRFVTVFEPVGKTFPALVRVGRVAAPRDVVVLRVETIDGPEYVLINLRAGQTQRRLSCQAGVLCLSTVWPCGFANVVWCWLVERSPRARAAWSRRPISPVD